MATAFIILCKQEHMNKVRFLSKCQVLMMFKQLDYESLLFRPEGSKGSMTVRFLSILTDSCKAFGVQ